MCEMEKTNVEKENARDTGNVHAYLLDTYHDVIQWKYLGILEET